MTSFVCKNPNTGLTLKEFNLNTISRQKAINQCVQLQLEVSTSTEQGQSAQRATGDPAIIEGRWKDIDGVVNDVYKSEPESRQKIHYKPFDDRHAHDRIVESFTERLDYVFQRAAELDGDDKTRAMEMIFRDITSVVRALYGDIFDLQERLGEAMVRLDALEDWNGAAYNDGFDLPGHDIPHHDQYDPHPPYPHFHGRHLILDREQDLRYHQGRMTLYDPLYQKSPGMKRYLAAQQQAGVSKPENSPHREEKGYRFDQSKLKGDGSSRTPV
jgi:hypothetical protein